MKLLLARYSWFVAIGAFFFYRDACLGGSERSPTPAPPPADADAAKSGLLDTGDTLARQDRLA